MAMAPGWYQDPFSTTGYVRWWDGERWGASTALPEGTPPVPPGSWMVLIREPEQEQIDILE